MHRFFVESDTIKGNEIEIKGSDARHIRDVLRLKTGNTIIAVDGSSVEYKAIIKEMTKDKIICDITEKSEAMKEPVVNVTLAQSIPKREKMETIIKMTTELGIKEIIPVITERVIVQGDFKKKVDRWQKIAMEASKQSGRTKMPKIREAAGLEEVLKKVFIYDLAIIPFELHKELSISEILKRKRIYDIILFIGPEGGFSHEEIQLAKNYGVFPVTLGNRILRVETAAVAATTLIMQQFKEM